MKLTRTLTRSLAAVGLAVAMVAGPATAALADHNFETPSGNISCAYSTYTDEDGDSVDAMGCILYDINLGSDADGLCDESFQTIGFLLARTGRAGYGCFDPSEFDEAVVLGYGKSFRRGGITCTARKTGLTCKNASGRGFTISRSAQRVF
jgi:hypothetical protein